MTGIPNLFIVGAAKCGTSALAAYLGQHPEIFIAPSKEVKYFGSDLIGREPGLFGYPPERYLEEFSLAGQEKIIGESTPQYLYSVLAAKEIKAFSPEAKIVILIREPVEMMHSLHQQLIFVGYEKEKYFHLALRNEEKEIQESFYKGIEVEAPQKTYYKQRANYLPQIKRYFDTFGRDNVLVLPYDRLRDNPKAMFIEVCDYLSVDSKICPRFEIVNKNKVHRSKTMHRLIVSQDRLYKNIWKKLPTSVKRPVKQAILRLNTQHRKRFPIPPELEKELKAEFFPLNKALEDYLQIDLSSWSS